MSDSAITYTLYIQADPARVWQALTDPALTRRYWGLSFETDWAVGSAMDWVERGARTSDPEQVVLDCIPDRVLSYTWHTFTPQWAASVGIAEELRAELAKERRTKVTYEIEPVGETLARLTILHEGFEPGGTLIGMCGRAWPMLASSLKTLLETGAPLPEPEHEGGQGAGGHEAHETRRARGPREG
ncbi:SRPBCC domain-containing protein [Streptomyces sp. NPDC001586]|uniref:SRPBCC domain-containing protein n=1 Tax=Streptomyces sp. NPDC001586 TaxID=3154387 RepID=UPI00332FED52